MEQDLNNGNFNWIERKIVNPFFKVLDFILGRDENYYQRMVQDGRRLMGENICKYAQNRLETEITHLYLVGMMDTSKEQFLVQKAKIAEGSYQAYFQSGNYAITEGVILFFQVKTIADKYYVLGWQDSDDFMLPDLALFMEPLSGPIDTSSLSDLEYLYYPIGSDLPKI